MAQVILEERSLPQERRLSYAERMALLRETKQQQTLAKKGLPVYHDGDDYGSICPPEGFRWECIPNHPNGSFYGYEGWSRNFYHLMELHPVYLDPADAFTCRWMFCIRWLKDESDIPDANWRPDLRYDDLKPEQTKYDLTTGIGSDAHFAGDYELGLRLGFGGLRGELEQYHTVNPAHSDYYAAELLTLDAVRVWMEHTIAATREASAREPNAQLRENLEAMTRVNEHLLENPPATLREACQWVCWYNMASRTYNRDGAGFQLDEVLRPYYERDLAAGLITREEAVFYLSCLLLNDPHYYQVSGLSPDGRDMTTYFSYMVLEAADQLNASCNITVRVHNGIDRDFLREGVRYLFRRKNGWPRFSGDEALARGFMRLGYSRELARQRIAVGCHWMSLPGLEYTLNDCVKVNLAKVLEVALDELMSSPVPPSSDRLWSLLERHLRRAVEVTADGIAFHLQNQVKNEPELMLNLLTRDSIPKGLDASHGGATYYNLCIDGAGLATVADSLGALSQRIETEGRLTWREMYACLQNDYAGTAGERVRQMLSSAPHYGYGSGDAEAWAVKLTELFSRLVLAQGERYPTLVFIPGWFSWSSTITLGKAVGATPNGRKAHAPINHGANPHPGFRRDGALTAMSNAIIKAQPGYGNTAPIQLELDPGLAESDEAVDKLVDYLLTIFQQGATLLNINIIDKDRILAAHKDPSLYPDLVVRVTGFTAYFCLLTPEFRQLVVDRILACE